MARMASQVASTRGLPQASLPRARGPLPRDAVVSQVAEVHPPAPDAALQQLKPRRTSRRNAAARLQKLEAQEPAQLSTEPQAASSRAFEEQQQQQQQSLQQALPQGSGQLEARLRKATSREEVLACALHEHGQPLQPVELVFVCSTLARMCDPQNMNARAWVSLQAGVQQLLQVHGQRSRLCSLSAYELVVLFTSLARMRIQPSVEWLDSYFTASLPVLPSYGPGFLYMLLRSLSRLELTLAKLKSIPSFRTWIHSLMAVSQSKVWSYRGDELVRTLSALSALHWQPRPEWLETFSTAIKSRLDFLDPPMLSQALVALSVLRQGPAPALLRAMGSQLSSKLPMFDDRDLASVAQAMFLIKRMMTPDFFSDFMVEVGNKSASFSPTALTHLLHALAQLVEGGHMAVLSPTQQQLLRATAATAINVTADSQGQPQKGGGRAASGVATAAAAVPASGLRAVEGALEGGHGGGAVPQSIPPQQPQQNSRLAAAGEGDKAAPPPLAVMVLMPPPTLQPPQFMATAATVALPPGAFQPPQQPQLHHHQPQQQQRHHAALSGLLQQHEPLHGLPLAGGQSGGHLGLSGPPSRGPGSGGGGDSLVVPSREVLTKRRQQVQKAVLLAELLRPVYPDPPASPQHAQHTPGGRRPGREGGQPRGMSSPPPPPGALFAPPRGSHPPLPGALARAAGARMRQRPLLPAASPAWLQAVASRIYASILPPSAPSPECPLPASTASPPPGSPAAHVQAGCASAPLTLEEAGMGLRALVTLGLQLDPTQLDAFFASSMPTVKMGTARAFLYLVQALAMSGYRPPSPEAAGRFQAWMRELALAAARRSYLPAEVCDFLTALAELPLVPPPALLDALLVLTRRNRPNGLRHMSPARLGRLASALRVLGHQPEFGFMHAFAQAARFHWTNIEPKDVACILSGLAAMRPSPLAVDTLWISEMLLMVQCRLHRFDMPSLTVLMAAVAVLAAEPGRRTAQHTQHEPPALWLPSDTWLEAVCSRLEEMSLIVAPLHAASLLWSIATLAQLQLELQPTPPSPSAQQQQRVAGASPALLARLAACASEGVATLTPAQKLDVAWALRMLGLPELPAAELAAARALVVSSLSEQEALQEVGAGAEKEAPVACSAAQQAQDVAQGGAGEAQLQHCPPLLLLPEGALSGAA